MTWSLGRTLRLAATAAVLVAPTLSAQAFSNRTSGLANPATTITFDEPGIVSGPIANQYASIGVFFSNLSLDDDAFGTGHTATNFADGSSYGPFSIMFSSAVSSIGFQYVTNESPTPSVLTAYLNGSVVATFEAFAHYPPEGDEWFGFENVTLDRLDVAPETLVNRAAVIDNLEFTPATVTPEPATVALLATGLLGVGGFARRRKKATKA